MARRAIRSHSSLSRLGAIDLANKRAMRTNTMATAGVLLLALALLGPTAHASFIDQQLHADGGKMCYHIVSPSAYEGIKCREDGFFWIQDPGSTMWTDSGWCCPCTQGTIEYDKKEKCFQCPVGYTTVGGTKTSPGDCVPMAHLAPGNKFGLRTNKNSFVGLQSYTPTGPSLLQAVYPWIGEWESITAVASPLPRVDNLNGYVNTQLAFNFTYLRSSNKGLVTNAMATANTPVVTNHAATVDSYEHMIVEPRTRDGAVSIRFRGLQHVWQATNGGGSSIVLRNVPIGGWELFNVVFHGGLKSGQVVALKTQNGRYVSTTSPQGKTVQEVTSGPTSVGLWERWEVMLPAGSNGSVIALRSLSYGLDYEGKQRMMIALSNGDVRVIWATPSDSRTHWEIIPRTGSNAGGWVSLRNVGINGGSNYMRAINGGGAAVDINALTQGDWENFQVVPAY